MRTDLILPRRRLITSRRELLLGGAALSSGLGGPAFGAGANGPPWPEAAFRLKHNTPLMAINSQNPLANGVVMDTTSNSVNVRRLLYAPTSCDLVDITIAIQGSYFTPAETDMPTPFTISTAQIEYPIGTFQKVYAADGGQSLGIRPGRTFSRFLPGSVRVKAGDPFAIKLWGNWTPGSFPMKVLEQWETTGSWSVFGTDLTDQTGTATTFTSADGSHLFGNLQVFARPTRATAHLGLLGDSITATGLDQADPTTGAIALEKAVRNVIPVTNIGMGGDSALTYLTRHDTRDMFFRDPITGSITITDLYLGMGRNEMGAGTAFQTSIRTMTDLWLSRGVRVHWGTITPHTTSTNHYADTTNQSVADATEESNRLTSNTYLRANAAAAGVTHLFDWAHIMDPGDTGKWACPDAAAGYWGLMVPTMSGRAIASVARANYPNHAATGQFYPANTTVTCAVYPYPGDTGSGGGSVQITFTPEGWVPTSGTVLAGGDYDFPPMIVVPGSLPGDGLHPAVRGFQEMIHQSGIGPASFPL